MRPQSMTPPSTENVHRAIASLLRPSDGDGSEQSVRCQMLYQATDTKYTVWVRSGIREWLSGTLARYIGRPLQVSDDYWTLSRVEVELLLTATSV